MNKNMDENQFKQRMINWYEICQNHDSTQPDRLARWRNLEPESAQYLMQLICMIKTQQVLELGTSNGFSTAWLAYALKCKLQQGHLITVEIDPTRSELATFALEQLDLADVVDFIVADVKEVLKYITGQYGLIFLDAERSEYQFYVKDLKRLLKLRVGNTLVVDNVISHKAEVVDFINVFKNDQDFDCETLDIGAGLFVAHYTGRISKI